MGLDMYLNKHHYIGADYEHNKITGTVEIFKDDIPIQINLNEIGTIVSKGVQWRKVNHIHKWFVNNVQDGEDDCKEYYVLKADIKCLINICKEVLLNPEKAEELLPTQEGCFFGGTDYDEYYLEDCRYTLAELEKLELECGDISYYYSSSW